MSNLKVIVTGARGALGTAVIHVLEGQGHQAVGIDRTVEDDVQDRRTAFIDCSDLADREAAIAAVQSAATGLGRIDAVIHLAGTFALCPVMESNIDLWRSMFRDNVETCLNVLQAARPFMASGSSVVTIGSSSVEPAGVAMGPYGSAKAAVARLTEALAAELADKAIRANCLLPKIMDTPANRAAMPDCDPAGWTSCEAVAEAAAFLVSPASRAIHGALIPVTNAIR